MAAVIRVFSTSSPPTSTNAAMLVACGNRRAGLRWAVDRPARSRAFQAGLLQVGTSAVPARDWDEAHLINAAIDIHCADPAFGYRIHCR